MSILIKGMEMPFTCWACEFGHIINCPQWENHTMEIVLDKDTKRHPDCPLVEVPPHGRLIDADALVAEFHRLTLGGNSLIERFFADGVYVVIDNAPTIIPAEEET